jgi:hypothetical protein
VAASSSRARPPTSSPAAPPSRASTSRRTSAPGAKGVAIAYPYVRTEVFYAYTPF